MKLRDALVFCFLVGVGSLQMAADALGRTKVKAFAAAMQMSPAMKVFTAHEGYETHAARFALSWYDEHGSAHTVMLDPQRYSNVQGPYNRRNVYGAAFAYGPLLRHDRKLKPMQDSVMRYALCEPGVLRHTLGIPTDVTRFTAYVMPVSALMRTDLELSWEVNCNE